MKVNLMSRFNDEEHRFDEDENFEDDDNEYNEDEDLDSDYDEFDRGFVGEASVPASMINQWKEAELEIEENKVDFDLLKSTIKFLENSFFWKFTPLSVRMKRTLDCYTAFCDLVKNTR